MRAGLLLGLLATTALMAGCASTNTDQALRCYRENTVRASSGYDTPQIMTYDPRTKAETYTTVNGQSGEITVSGYSDAGTVSTRVSSDGASADVSARGTRGAVAVKDDSYKFAARSSGGVVGVSGDLSSGRQKECKYDGLNTSGGFWPWGSRRPTTGLSSSSK